MNFPTCTTLSDKNTADKILDGQSFSADKISDSNPYFGTSVKLIENMLVAKILRDQKFDGQNLRPYYSEAHFSFSAPT